VRIRLQGSPQECAAWVRALSGTARIGSVSRQYPDRGARTVRVYLDAASPEPREAQPEEAEPSR
jgi:hypothetical protein